MRMSDWSSDVFSSDPSVQPVASAREAAELGRIAHDIDVAEGAAGVKAEGDRGADGVALVENQAETAIDFPPHLAPRRPGAAEDAGHEAQNLLAPAQHAVGGRHLAAAVDRQSTRLNSSH